MPTWFRKLLLVAGLLAWGLIVAEVSVRLLDPKPLMPRYVTGTAWGVRGNIPGAVYRHRTPEVNIEYRINQQGLRADREYPLAPPQEACRIGLIGDSFFVGYEADLPDTIARRLELELGSRGIDAEVLNFSVSGFGTAEMLRTWEGQMRAFAPDLVVMQWHVTDLDDNIRSGLYFVRDGQLQRGAATFLPSIAMQDRLMRSWLYRFVADNSQLYSFVRERAAGAVKGMLVLLQQARGEKRESSAPADAAPATATPETAGPTPAAMLSALLLREAQAQVEASGAGFIVVDIPEADHEQGLSSAWGQLPVELVGEVPVVHAADAMKPLIAPGVDLFYKRGHFHLTPLSVGAVSAALAGRVEPMLRQGRCGVRLGEQAVGP